MNGKSGYCVARYEGGGMYGLSKVDSIMLRFRPIAPKPVAVGSGLVGSGNSDAYVSSGRSKRKYVRVNKNRKKKDNSKLKVKAASPSPPTAAVTLSLLPETPDPKEHEPVVTGSGSFSDLLSSTSSVQKTTTKWLSFNNRHDETPVRRPHVVSNVTVECVTDTWVDLGGLGCTDEERLMNMERDTCPGFISDGQDRVVWTNKAYREMTGLGNGVNGDDMAVVLVRKDKLTPLPVTYPAFTCKVKVTSAPQSEYYRQSPSPSSPTLTLPCDVWRMERGACAWRLDVKAALSLGR